jgi:hypothetical protein
MNCGLGNLTSLKNFLLLADERSGTEFDGNVQAIGLGAALEWFMRFDRDAVAAHEQAIYRHARDRLAALVAAAWVRPVQRRATRPTLGSKQRRLVGKAVRSGIKAGRGKVTSDD